MCKVCTLVMHILQTTCMHTKSPQSLWATSLYVGQYLWFTDLQRRRCQPGCSEDCACHANKSGCSWQLARLIGVLPVLLHGM
jgi:hypothetical protein